jgi:hypothetical protein
VVGGNSSSSGSVSSFVELIGRSRYTRNVLVSKKSQPSWNIEAWMQKSLQEMEEKMRSGQDSLNAHRTLN